MTYCPWCESETTDADPQPSDGFRICTQCGCLHTTQPITHGQLLKMLAVNESPLRQDIHWTERPFTVRFRNSDGTVSVLRGYYNPTTKRVIRWL